MRLRFRGQKRKALTGQHHLTFSHFFLQKTTCHREALFAEAIFLQARDCFAEKRSQ
jgi:hypothetical protein